MDKIRKFSGLHCYLTPIDGKEAELVAKWSNDTVLSMKTGDISDMISVETQKSYLESMTGARGYGFYIVSLPEDSIVGVIRFMRINWISKNAIMGIFIGEENARGRGIGEEATKMILDFGFHVLNLKNVMVEIYSFNHPSLSLAQKCGFKEIGRRRNAIFFGDRAFDEVFLDILAEEHELYLLKDSLQLLYGK